MSVAAGFFELLTSPGPAAIAVIRVGGPDTGEFLQRHVQTATASGSLRRAGDVQRATLVDSDGAALDDILISVHAAPPAWDVRLHLHGNPWLVGHCVELLRAAGLCEAGAPGTGETPVPPLLLAGGCWPVVDALEAEACTILPHLSTLRGARWVLSQVQRLRAAIERLAGAQLGTAAAVGGVKAASPDDALAAARETCRAIAARSHIVHWFTQPVRIVLAGPPNAGKSTLANALADRVVSVVSAVPGTTRDWVELPAEIDGFPAVWLDTAGLRAGPGPLEATGIERTEALVRTADAVVIVLDTTESAAATRAEFVARYRNLEPACVALNKSDLAPDLGPVQRDLPMDWAARTVSLSALSRTGLTALHQRVLTALGRDAGVTDESAPFTDRQAELLRQAAGAGDAAALTGALAGLRSERRGHH